MMTIRMFARVVIFSPVMFLVAALWIVELAGWFLVHFSRNVTGALRRPLLRRRAS